MVFLNVLIVQNRSLYFFFSFRLLVFFFLVSKFISNFRFFFFRLKRWWKNYPHIYIYTIWNKVERKRKAKFCVCWNVLASWIIYREFFNLKYTNNATASEEVCGICSIYMCISEGVVSSLSWVFMMKWNLCTLKFHF